MHKGRNYKWLKMALSVSFFLLFFVASCSSNKEDSAKAELQRLALRQKVEFLEAAGEPVLWLVRH